MSKKSKKMSFGYCGETCPSVDGVFYKAYDEICEKLNLDEKDREFVFNLLVEDYCQEVKEVGTFLLRDSLDSACERIEELEDEVENLKYKISEIQNERI